MAWRIDRCWPETCTVSSWTGVSLAEAAVDGAGSAAWALRLALTHRASRHRRGHGRVLRRDMGQPVEDEVANLITYCELIISVAGG